VGKRLGYPTVIYAEWDARWWRWVDKFGAMKQEVVAQVPTKYAEKFTVVGDLMNEVRNSNQLRTQDLELRNQNSEFKETQNLEVGSCFLMV
jgi:hypothetical protein